jgi:hypothetical protein
MQQGPLAVRHPDLTPEQIRQMLCSFEKLHNLERAALLAPKT